MENAKVRSEEQQALEEKTLEEEVENLSFPIERKKLTGIEATGLALVIASMLTLLFSPATLAGLFDSILDSVVPVVVDTFLIGTVGVAIIISVIIGRTLERLGFTDALMRIFVPLMKFSKVNSSVVVPSIYNILGDINAAGKIAGPILVKAGATKAEQKIAVATMVQSQQSFSTFMLGIVALTAAGVNAFLVVVLAVMVPVLIMPFLLSKTVYRDTKPVELSHMPSFTPKTRALPTLFNAAREGAELLFLLIIPAVAVVFMFIGILNYIGIWSGIEAGLTIFLSALSIHPETGILSILASPTLGMAELTEVAASLDPILVIGSFILASSGLPLSAVFGQIPVIWAANSDLNEREAMSAALLGIGLRFVTIFLIVVLLGPFLL
ncbi:hypothetical protein ACFPU1_00455 [Thalassorhabdus alkalitolerans]|uniref:Nucleoside recognition GATE domain-containing membrane protein YjiH n=1 Tax=Thalassorhabdus alkalitolerans TaxID=2282697 RepID=A0ABW0YFN7_9BACI